MSDAELTYRLYKKFYSDKPLVGYAKDIGFDKSQSLDFLKFASDAGDTISYEKTAPTVGGDVGGVARGAFQGLTLVLVMKSLLAALRWAAKYCRAIIARWVTSISKS